MKHFNLMNNFRWFATIILLITLSIGQMWGATFTKITSLSNLTEGNYVIVGRQGASSWGILRAGTISSNKLTYTEDFSSTPPATITTTTASEIWYLTVDGTNVKLYNAGQNKYLNPGGTSLSYGGSGTNWTAGYSSGFRLGYGTYYLGVNKDANNWCAYVSGSLYSTTYGLTLYKEKCSVTLKDNNETITQATGGASITLPSRSGCEGYTFAGWTKSWTKDQSSWTTTAPTIIPAGSYTPTTNENLYPVYTKTASSSETKSYGWESTTHTDWTIGSQPSRSNSTTAHTGSYAGYINTANTYVTFVNKVYVTEFSFWLKRTTTNSNYNVYIETSTDGSSWTAAATYAMSSFGNGTYTQKTKTWDGTKAYYVRFHCYNTTAVRYVDDVSITYSVQTTSYISVPACTYSITYHCNDATDNCPDNASGQTALPNPLPTPSKTGYSFDGWYTNEGLTIAATAGATLVSNADLYAKWEEVPCDENPSIGGVSLNGSFNLTTVGVSCASSGAGENCTITNYGWVWSDGATNTNPLIDGSGVTQHNTSGAPSGSGGALDGTLSGSFTLGHTYYYKAYVINAKPATTYSDVQTFTPRSVTFDLNGHGTTAPDVQYVNNGGKASDPSYSESVTGYAFGGWYDNADWTQGTQWNFGTSTVSGGNVTLYAKWTPNPYTITLDQDLTPTSAGTASIAVTFDDDNNLDGTPAITPPTKTGWTFAGYYTAKNGGGTQIIDASGNVIASAGGGSTYTDASKNWKYADDITLYAKWTCTVTWSVAGHTDVYAQTTVTYNSTSSKVGSIPTPNPNPASYCGDKFVGWTSDENYVHGTSNLFTTVGDSPNLNSIGSTTFYAVFADYDD